MCNIIRFIIASAGYYTSKFDEACIVVIDVIGEWETVTIWYGNDDKLEKRWSQKYPKSIGLFYLCHDTKIRIEAARG